VLDFVANDTDDHARIVVGDFNVYELQANASDCNATQARQCSCCCCCCCFEM
jgi:hypothetical protein